MILCGTGLFILKVHIYKLFKQTSVAQLAFYLAPQCRRNFHIRGNPDNLKRYAESARASLMTLPPPPRYLSEIGKLIYPAKIEDDSSHLVLGKRKCFHKTPLILCENVLITQNFIFFSRKQYILIIPLFL